jgi:putative SOS response-associated peptidase YedK
MPVIVAPADFDRWLDPSVAVPGVADLLRPFPAEQMHAGAVGTHVNNPSNDDPTCSEPWE